MPKRSSRRTQTAYPDLVENKDYIIKVIKIRRGALCQDHRPGTWSMLNATIDRIAKPGDGRQQGSVGRGGLQALRYLWLPARSDPGDRRTSAVYRVDEDEFATLNERRSGSVPARLPVPRWATWAGKSDVLAGPDRQHSSLSATRPDLTAKAKVIAHGQGRRSWLTSSDERRTRHHRARQHPLLCAKAAVRWATAVSLCGANSTFAGTGLPRSRSTAIFMHIGEMKRRYCIRVGDRAHC